MTAIWNDVVNHTKKEECTTKTDGGTQQCLKVTGKILATTTVHRTVDADTACVNSCKAQHERKYGKIKRVKESEGNRCNGSRGFQ